MLRYSSLYILFEIDEAAKDRDTVRILSPKILAYPCGIIKYLIMGTTPFKNTLLARFVNLLQSLEKGNVEVNMSSYVNPVIGTLP